MKYADKIGAKYVIVIGESELAEGVSKLKNMQSGEETEVPLGESLVATLYNITLAEAVKGISETDFASNLML